MTNRLKNSKLQLTQKTLHWTLNFYSEIPKLASEVNSASLQFETAFVPIEIRSQISMDPIPIGWKCTLNILIGSEQNFFDSISSFPFKLVFCSSLSFFPFFW